MKPIMSIFILFCIKSFSQEISNNKICGFTVLSVEAVRLQKEVLKNLEPYKDFKKLYFDEKFEEAIKGTDYCIEKGIELTDAYFYKGLALQSLKKYEDAIINYKKAIGYDNSLYWFYSSIAYSYSKLEKYDSAINYQNVLKINYKKGDESWKFLTSIAFPSISIAKYKAKINKYDSAIIDLENLLKEVEEYPKDQWKVSKTTNSLINDIYNELAWISIDNGNFAKANTYIEKAFSISDTLAISYATLGYYYYKNKQVDKSYNAFNKVFEYYKDIKKTYWQYFERLEDVYYCRGLLNFDKQDKNAACADMENANKYYYKEADLFIKKNCK